MTTFQDIFKSNFLENVTSVTVLDMVLAIVRSPPFTARKLSLYA